MAKTCATCINFRLPEPQKEYETIESYDEFGGTCVSGKFIESDKTPKDGLQYADYEGYSASFYVGSDFGCIHHTVKE